MPVNSRVDKQISVEFDLILRLIICPRENKWASNILPYIEETNR